MDRRAQRQHEGAHVAFPARCGKSLGLKCGPTMTPDGVAVIELLNPDNEPGRLTRSRAWVRTALNGLPPLIRAVQREGRSVVWS